MASLWVKDWAGGTLEENAQFLNFFSSLLEGDTDYLQPIHGS